MKYIDADKLKAEIDNLESFSCISEEQDGFYSAISRINGIIDSLQQEQPETFDTAAFQKGVQEGRRLMMEEWLKDHDGCFWDGVNEGKKAMKEQMMEGAVECSASVCKLADKVWVTPNDEKKFHQDVFDHFIAGDKVRIIIAKEDEQ